MFLKGALIMPDRVLPNGLIQVADGKIFSVWDLEQGPAPTHDPKETLYVDAGYIAPGSIDLHVHGGGGADFMDADPEAVATITETHARYGTTGLLATTLTDSEERIVAAIRAAQAAPRRGAQVLGFHIEGPFVNPKWKGAQDERFMRHATIPEIDRWFAAAREGYAWQVTLAPELPGAHGAIRHLVARGAIVSAGHTDCNYAQLREAAAVGLAHVTHLYNAMHGLHHREPGAVGGALTLPGFTVEMIADGIHVHPAAMAIAVASRGPGSVLLITDAMRAAGMLDGDYLLGDLMTHVANGQARLADGTLAGSVVTMASAISNMVNLVGVPLHQAVAMASLNPARLQRLDARKGSIAAGKDADLVILSPTLQVQLTMVGGQIVFDGR
jgi:N-acetylglucosamine-6-phosphate deacetylase